jgi:hypothetical protein
MLIIKRLPILCLFIAINYSIWAQSISFFGALPAINLTARLTEKCNFNMFASTTIDAFTREIDGINYPSSDLQLYLQPSIVYNPTKQINFSFSYTYQRNNPFRTIFVNEHRLWQQAMFIKNLNKGKLTNRFRFEERFIENKLTEHYPLSTRLRYQIGYTVPLKRKQKETSKIYFNTYNEFYFSLSGQKNAFYSENWSYAGVGFNLSHYNKIELGYLFQTFVRNPAKDLRFLNLIQVTWIKNFNGLQPRTKKVH